MVDKLKEVIKKQILLLKPDETAIKEMWKKSREFISELKKEISKNKIKADVFVGGSFAKGTLLKSDNYDVDIFARFDSKYDGISDKLEKFLKKVSKKFRMNLERVHGSRDYFRVYIDNTPGYFEVIPVVKIRKPQEEKNVTDLTYFHGPYIIKRISGLEGEVRIAKQFLKAQEVYGAETYVKGFSGYAVELLILKYRSFVNMLKALVKVSCEKRLVIDIEKHYKNPDEAFIQLNEAKIHSPVILIDPTYKERNALAALSQETFEKFQKCANAFIKKPTEKFFKKRTLVVEDVRKKAGKNNLAFVTLTTDKQQGDIAGTKLKKFFDLILREIREGFIVKDSYFKYSSGNSGFGYIIAKPKKEIVRIGPPLHLHKAVLNFKNKHAVTFEKNKYIHAKLEVKFTLKEFLDSWKSGSYTIMEQMHITDFIVED